MLSKMLSCKKQMFDLLNVWECGYSASWLSVMISPRWQLHLRQHVHRVNMSKMSEKSGCCCLCLSVKWQIGTFFKEDMRSEDVAVWYEQAATGALNRSCWPPLACRLQARRTPVHVQCVDVSRNTYINTDRYTDRYIDLSQWCAYTHVSVIFPETHTYI